jgi:hypothetical protein
LVPTLTTEAFSVYRERITRAAVPIASPSASSILDFTTLVLVLPKTFWSKVGFADAQASYVLG